MGRETETWRSERWEFFCFMCKGKVGKVTRRAVHTVLQIRWFPVPFRSFVQVGSLVRSFVRPGSVCSFTRLLALLRAG